MARSAATFATLALLMLHGSAAAQPCTPLHYFLPATHVPVTGAFEIASADFDHDGFPDLAVATFSSGMLTVLLNRPPGFQSISIAAGRPSNLVVGDFYEDGHADVAVLNFPGSVIVHRGDGTGAMTPGPAVTVPANARGIATGDFDDDGVADLAVASSSGVAVLLGNGAGGVGDGSFQPAVVYSAPSPWGVTVGDFNSDGLDDLAIANGSHVSISILLGGPAGTFQPAYGVGISGTKREIVAHDVDRDGIMDLVAAGSWLDVLFGVGNNGVGTGQFLLKPIAGNYNGVTVADFTGDGIPDLAAADPGFAWVRFWRGLGSRLFAGAEAYACQAGPVGIVDIDVTLDGALDVVTANTLSSISVLPGTCHVPGPPVVMGFIPGHGRVGDPVAVTGLRLADATSVEFHDGVKAPILSTDFNRVHTLVPPGATTGPIRVITPIGTSTSPASFEVGEPPLVSDASPRSAKRGASVLIDGERFTGASRVSFGGATAAPFTIETDQRLRAIVDEGATSGTVRVTTRFGTGASAFDFIVVPPDTAPRIAAVRDVPNDQGGRVALEWLRSDLDDPVTRRISGYRVWRRAPAAAASMALVPTFEHQPHGTLTTGFWEPLVTLPAAFLDGYAWVAPTTRDSTETGNPHSAFFVQALTTTGEFYNSPIDSGYSVDNLSPAPPSGFAGGYQPSGVALRWHASPEADLLGYRLHRGTSPDFVAHASNLVAAPSDTQHFDPEGNGTNVYKLAAVDLHGNLSPFVALAIPGAPVERFGVLAWPNPSAAGFEVRLTLGADGPATLELLDVSGRLVSVRTATGAGSHALRFERETGLPPGVYLLRLTQNGRRSSAKLVLLK